MPQIVDVLANKNARNKRNDLRLFGTHCISNLFMKFCFLFLFLDATQMYRRATLCSFRGPWTQTYPKLCNTATFKLEDEK